MVKRIGIVAGIVFLQCYTLLGQSIECGTNLVENTYSKSTSSAQYLQSHINDGQYMTAYGHLNILVVFMSYPDDPNSSNWPSYNYQSIIAETPQDIDLQKDQNISSYYKIASGDSLIITGDAVSVVAPKNSYEYTSRAEVVTDVLTNVIANDTTIELSDYDNWKFDNSGGGNHINQPDTLVDMIVFIHSNNANMPYSGEASLAARNTILTINGINVGLGYAGYNWAPTGSGVSVLHKRREYAFYVAVHEIAHWLNQPHPYYEGDSYTGNYSFHTWMGTDWNPRIINAYERSLVGWHEPTDITTDTVLTLGDYLTTGDAVKVPLSSNDPDNYLYIENHQKVNPIYDRPTDNTSEKGLMMYSMDGNYRDTNSVVSESAFGRWDWSNGQLTQSPGDPNEVTYIQSNTAPNSQFGTTNREKRNHGEDSHKMTFLAYNDDGTVRKGRFDRGEYLGNMFSLGYKSYYSKITNPAPLTFTGGSQQISNVAYSDISVQILSEEANGDVVLRVETNHNPYLITEDVTWRGEIFLDNDVTVQSGAKLSVNDATVYVGDNVDITIEGELYTHNTTFTAKNNRWDYITFESGSEGSISETVIEKGQAYGGAAVRIMDNQNKIEINESTIQNFSGACGGISVNNSSAVYVYRTTFNNLSGDPIRAYNSIIYALENNIEASGSQSGVYANSFSDVTFSGTSYGYYKGKNTIIGGKYGIKSGYMSDLNAGSTPYFGNENRILNQLPHNNDWAHIYASHSTATIYAEYNYWKPYNNSGGGSPVTKGTGTILVTNYLTSDPGPALKQVATPPAFGEETKPHVKVIAAAKKLMYEGAFTEARKNLIDAFTLFNHEQPALDLLKAYLTLAKTDTSGINYINNIKHLTKSVSSIVKPYFNLAIATLYIHENEYNNAEEVLTTVIEKYSDSDHSFHAHILSAFTWLQLGNISEAESHLQRAIEYNINQNSSKRLALPEESRYATAISNAQFSIRRAQEKRAAKNGTGSFSEPNERDSSSVEKKDAIVQNHPNPFNPTTTISFSIPDRSHVQLVVYDVLGREVATLASRNFKSGKHSIRFDASDLSSGIYFYHLKTENYSLVRQMTLIK